MIWVPDSTKLDDVSEHVQVSPACSSPWCLVVWHEWPLVSTARAACPALATQLGGNQLAEMGRVHI